MTPKKTPEPINTLEVSPCDKCNCMTYTLMDADGNRSCGKCKEEKAKPESKPWDWEAGLDEKFGVIDRRWSDESFENWWKDLKRHVQKVAQHEREEGRKEVLEQIKAGMDFELHPGLLMMHKMAQHNERVLEALKSLRNE